MVEISKSYETVLSVDLLYFNKKIAKYVLAVRKSSHLRFNITYAMPAA